MQQLCRPNHIQKSNAMMTGLIQHSDKVKKLSQPLKENFGISYFYQFRICNDGKFFILTNDPDIDEYWFREEMFLIDPFVKHPNNYRAGFLFMEAYAPTDYKSDLNFIKNNWNAYPWLCMIDKNIDSFDFFGFWGNPLEHCKLRKMQMNHAMLLKTFTSYFKSETRSLVKELENRSHSIIDFIGKDAFYENQPLIPTMERDSLRKFLIQIGMGHKVLQAEALSKRERECLKIFILGKSAKDIALELRLSFRTVEHYLENSRNKLNCCNKGELFSTAKELEELGLFH